MIIIHCAICWTKYRVYIYNRVTGRPSQHFSQTKGYGVGGVGALKKVLNANLLDKVVENFCIKRREQLF